MHKFISHIADFQIYDDDLWSGKSCDLQVSYQNRLSERKVIPCKVCACVCVCVSVWTHMLVCPWAHRAFELQELIPSIRISAGKGDKYALQLKWPAEDMHISSHTHTHTTETLAFVLLISLQLPFFVISPFSSLPCPHLLWSKITGCYQRSWNQSLSLLIVGTLIHYISTKVLSFPLYSPTSHQLPLATHFFCSLKTILTSYTLSPDLFSGMWKPTLLFLWLVWYTESRKGKATLTGKQCKGRYLSIIMKSNINKQEQNLTIGLNFVVVGRNTLTWRFSEKKSMNCIFK